MGFDPSKTFKFTVEADGKFVYDPSGDWAYNHLDQIRFQTGSGPFTIKFLPITPIPVPTFNPLGGPLTAKQIAPGIYAADTTVHDSLTDLDREVLMKANVDSDHREGFVGRYRYGIEVKRDGQVYRDDTKNGQYSC